jgi:hypothetical protein
MRGTLYRRQYYILPQYLSDRDVALPIVRLQSRLRGLLACRRTTAIRQSLIHRLSSVIHVQATGKGLLIRHQRSAVLRALHDAVRSITNLQAQLRGFLIRQRKNDIIDKLTATLPITRLQSHLRGMLACQRTTTIRQSLVHHLSSVIHVQATVKGLLVRHRRRTAHFETAGSATWQASSTTEEYHPGTVW